MGVLWLNGQYLHISSHSGVVGNTIALHCSVFCPVIFSVIVYLCILLFFITRSVFPPLFCLALRPVLLFVIIYPQYVSFLLRVDVSSCLSVIPYGSYSIFSFPVAVFIVRFHSQSLCKHSLVWFLAFLSSYCFPSSFSTFFYLPSSTCFIYRCKYHLWILVIVINVNIGVFDIYTNNY